MRIAAVIIAIVLALGFIALAVFGDNSEGPPIDSVVIAITLLGAAIIALRGGDLRFLSAAYGISLGVLYFFGELMFRVGNKNPDSAESILQFIALMLLPFVGLVLTLFARNKPRAAGTNTVG